jgi:hypothetical protein
VQQYQNVLQDKFGNVIVGASVAVYVYGTTTPATIYSGNGSGVLPSNTVTTNSLGEFAFYAANGRYSLTVTATNFVLENYSDFILYDPADIGAVTASGVAFTPYSTIAATNVQNAIQEVVTDLSASSGSSLVGFLQSGTSAQATTVQAKLRESVSVKDFGAVGDNVTNDTAAIQAALTAATGKSIYFPAGTYKYSTLTIAAGMRLYGDGASSRLYTTQTSGGGVTVTTTSAVIVENMTFTSAGAQTSGGYFVVNPGAGENTQTTFRKVAFDNYFIAVQFIRASLWTIDNCYFGTAGIAGSISVSVQNDNVADSGDNNITACTFYFSTNLGTHIKHISGGGLRIINNKFLYGEYHYHMVLAAGAVTSDLIFSANSSEFADNGNIVFDGIVGGTFANTTICGNEYTVSTGKYGILVNSISPSWLDGVLITDCIFGSNGAAFAIAISDVRRCTIGPNIYRMNAGSTGILLGTNTAGVDIMPQSYNSITTPISGPVTTTGVSVVSQTGIFFTLAAGASQVVSLTNSLTSSTSLIVVGGTVQSVGYVNGLYMATGPGTVTTVAAIANVAVSATATTITVTNNTGQIFNGKVLVNY